MKRGSNQRDDEQRCLEYEAGGTAHRCGRARARICTPSSREHGKTTLQYPKLVTQKTKTDKQEPSAQERMSLNVPGASGALVSAHGSWSRRWCRCCRVLLGLPVRMPVRECPRTAHEQSDEQREATPKIRRELDQINTNHAQNLHRPNSMRYESSPKKSFPWIKPNSGKTRS